MRESIRQAGFCRAAEKRLREWRSFAKRMNKAVCTRAFVGDKKEPDRDSSENPAKQIVTNSPARQMGGISQKLFKLSS